MAKIQRCPVCDVMYATADGICPHCHRRSDTEPAIPPVPTPTPAHAPALSAEMAFEVLRTVNKRSPEILIPDREGGSIHAEFLNRSYLNHTSRYMVLFPLDRTITNPYGLTVIVIDDEAETYTVLKDGDEGFRDYIYDFLDDYEMDALDNPSPRLKAIYNKAGDEE